MANLKFFVLFFMQVQLKNKNELAEKFSDNPIVKITNLLKNLKIKTNNIRLYAEALTHNSYDNEQHVGYNYQRLEFLGDSIINKIVSCHLYNEKEHYSEKQMTDLRKMLVSNDALRKAATELNLLQYACVGKGIKKEREIKSIMPDLFESLSGAIYLDQGEAAVFKFLQKTIFKYYAKEELSAIDYKSKMQELLRNALEHELKPSNYFYVTEEIPAANPIEKTFKSSLVCNDIVYGVGHGNSKKEAEKKAAQNAYEKYAAPKISKTKKATFKLADG